LLEDSTLDTCTAKKCNATLPHTRLVNRPGKGETVKRIVFVSYEQIMVRGLRKERGKDKIEKGEKEKSRKKKQ